ncbi:hypothetical protein [Leeuwenhoekiella sp. MAR_2009_132]|uniref:hypothetical protein n=1 Tax=Leeuwenhoekiella sp. MAR_2009_132 TaxID=1392489 RepID=UPI00048F3D84|nr:hypothetical protein [Leeuwenhoekiella sp. MAR_2009_132]
MKKLLISLFVFFSLLGVAAIFLNSYLKNQLQQIIKNDLPSSINLTYEDLNIDSWGGNASMKNATVSIIANDSMPRSEVNNATVMLKGLDHWDYFRNKNIHFKKITILADSLSHYKQVKKETKKSSKDSASTNPIKAENINGTFHIEEFELVTNYIQILKPETEDILLKTAHFNLNLQNITPTITETITRPFNYERISLSYDSLYYQINDFDELTVQNVLWDGSSLQMTNTQLKTAVSRKQLSNSISQERDHVNLLIKKISIDSLRYGERSGRFYINTPLILLEEPALNLYRDKLLADDFSTKPLYSKMLRDLKFDLMVDSLKIKNGSIIYTEKVNQGSESGSINFKNLQANLTNIGNTYKEHEKKTKIAIKAIFMKQSPMTLDWEFDVQNKQDKFYLVGSLSKLPVKNLDGFTSPNLGVEMQGNIAHTYFTITGNDYSSHIDMQMTYDDFKVNILNQEKKKKKWLASTIANIFISNTSKREDKGFKEGSGDVTRNQNKSFFNYLWINLKDGMLKTVTVLD